MSSPSERIDEICREILHNEFSSLDDKIPEFVDLLAKKGADQCWHKSGTFKEHLFRSWRTLKIWNQPNAICRLGLFHSAYSNKNVNLAIFDRDIDRSFLREKIGEEAEQLVYIFCVIVRQMFNDMDKLGKIPPEGMVVKHFITGEDLHLSAYVIAIFIIVTIADNSDQRYSWQDELYGTIWNITSDPGVLWPGDSRPGLWMTWASKLGQVIKNANLPDVVIPPIFNYFQDELTDENEKNARDLYWDVITKYRNSKEAEKALQVLQDVVELNPFVGEPHVLRAQILIQKKDYEKAVFHGEKGLYLLQIWGSAWDKRVSWEGWIAWVRVILLNAKAQKWPTTSTGIISLGLVQ